ncbi:TetR/AcrR family transcriptional regulator [Nocardia africana]|uniref:TetR/AcrR family transcriptional regulator n=1 Tax=Nocardia africana TaxID=134964 RepID=UPI001D145C4C|nr:TetR/AcrR family transcriptional regulator C-terminal domain-containing protein [Nocardia africana]MCC3312974.1 TetR/AcrR family transcriptional regulator C-terminal domain-containing protein [Nocardia africana]
MARRTQGTSAGLTRERIAAAAVALVDREGLERFGVRRLADELGVDPMSIYNHIKGKAALLDAVSEVVLAEMATDADAPETWEEIARWTAHSYRATAYRHPHVVALLATRPQTSPAALSTLERLVTAMRTAGLPDQVVSDTPMILFSFLNGYLLAVLSGGSDSAATVPAFDSALYPTMATLAPQMTDFGSATEFDRLLDTVLAGIRDRAARQQTAEGTGRNDTRRKRPVVR